jgi:hypothetical protein
LQLHCTHNGRQTPREWRTWSGKSSCECFVFARDGVERETLHYITLHLFNLVHLNVLGLLGISPSMSTTVISTANRKCLLCWFIAGLEGVQCLRGCRPSRRGTCGVMALGVGRMLVRNAAHKRDHTGMQCVPQVFSFSQTPSLSGFQKRLVIIPWVRCA